MYAVVVISLMFAAVIVMVKKADKEMTTMRISGRVEWDRNLTAVPEGRRKGISLVQHSSNASNRRGSLEKSLRQPTRQREPSAKTV
jgi:hypothetical protein